MTKSNLTGRNLSVHAVYIKSKLVVGLTPWIVIKNDESSSKRIQDEATKAEEPTR